MITPLASVEIAVTDFQDIRVTTAQPRWCQIDNPILKVDAGRVSVAGSLVTVHGLAPVDLAFEVSSLVEGRSFWPIGICFSQTHGAQDRHGRGNFAVKSIADRTVVIGDRVRDHGARGQAPRWKFFLAIQADDGAIGLIDPEVQNED